MPIKLKSTPLRFWRHLKYHRDIIKHLRWSRMDALRLDFYKTFIAPTDLVFDVGANMGNRSKIFRAIGARVVAYEPQSHCATFLRAAFNGDDRFTLVQAALSDSEGELIPSSGRHLCQTRPIATRKNEIITRSPRLK
jgi:hypothetical protein